MYSKFKVIFGFDGFINEHNTKTHTATIHETLIEFVNPFKLRPGATELPDPAGCFGVNRRRP